MSSKRKDNKGRVLHNGEYQQSNGRYRYKYYDGTGKARYLYSWRLDKNDRMPDGKRQGKSLREQEQDAGLHFLMRLDTALPDETLRQRASARGLRLALLSDYYQQREQAPHHVLVVNYSGIELEKLPQALTRSTIEATAFRSSRE